MASINFDPTKYEPSVGYAPLPPDSYLCTIERSEMKTTQKGDGEYLSLMLAVIDGQYSGRKIFDNLNLVNKTALAVEIAQKTLSAICHAVGVLQLVDTAELHDRPLLVTVKIKDGRNQVTAYAAASDYTAPTVSAPPAANAPAALKPWQKAAA